MAGGLIDRDHYEGDPISRIEDLEAEIERLKKLLAQALQDIEDLKP